MSPRKADDARNIEYRIVVCAVYAVDVVVLWRHLVADAAGSAGRSEEEAAAVETANPGRL